MHCADGNFEGYSVSILIDGGYSINMVSRYFVDHNRERLQRKIGRINAIISHSHAGMEEKGCHALEKGLMSLAEDTVKY